MKTDAVAGFAVEKSFRPFDRVACVAAALAAALLLAGCGKREGMQYLPGTAGGGGATQPGAAGAPPAAVPSSGAGGGSTAGTEAAPPAGGVGGASGAGAPVAPVGAAGQGAAGTGVAPDAGAGQPAPAGTDAAPMQPDAAVPREDLGEGDGRDVITIGDSWMSNTLLTGNAIEGALARLTGQPYRNYGVQGVLLLQSSLFGAAIPTQYDRAKSADPDIVTVIMTGGGNDIIQNPSVQASCAEGGDACKQKLAEIVKALDTLWTKMAEDGVKDVVFIRYSSDAGSTDDSLRGGGTPPAICLSGRIRCHSIDTTDAVMGDLQDGIHPTRTANDRIAKKVHDYMVANGIRR
jgi:hypothetical protein